MLPVESPGPVVSPGKARCRWGPRAFPPLMAGALIGVAAVLTLVSPPPDPAWAAERCVTVFPLPGGAHLAFSCDGFTFLRVP